MSLETLSSAAMLIVLTLAAIAISYAMRQIARNQPDHKPDRPAAHHERL